MRCCSVKGDIAVSSWWNIFHAHIAHLWTEDGGCGAKGVAGGDERYQTQLKYYSWYKWGSSPSRCKQTRPSPIPSLALQSECAMAMSSDVLPLIEDPLEEQSEIQSCSQYLISMGKAMLRHTWSALLLVGGMAVSYLRLMATHALFAHSYCSEPDDYGRFHLRRNATRILPSSFACKIYMISSTTV
jgi:hypothetical protein